MRRLHLIHEQIARDIEALVSAMFDEFFTGHGSCLEAA